ncbi:MAG: hypothetical protein AVDCRST_MAG29-775 [uncultured Nocardioidaceae bacterium]|uniref:DUF6752 domain-containing protein n=1 Tax=uncultured Nocardioidaceae bacterium TaxID=253824 RepID=A0A6J4L9R3_9ACTN|nr:MAG: hypothetical protein AVDCRST_MAG29-775 [uncultured Nocardioidaceae bacterium]
MAEVSEELVELRRRVADLEREVQENRVLNRRLAELIDVVAELLMPATYPDEQKLNEVLTRLADSR